MTLRQKRSTTRREAMPVDSVSHNDGSPDALTGKVACRRGAPMTWAHLAPLTRDQARQAP
jgi:hypothetical protein